MEKEVILTTLGEKGISLKKSNQDAVCGAIGGLMAGGFDFDKALAFVKANMASAFDADGIKALEVEKLVKVANSKLTEAYRVEALGILGNIDLASEHADELEAEYKTGKEAWDNTPHGQAVETLRQAALQAQLAFENRKSEAMATAEYKAVDSALNTWNTAAKKAEGESANLAALVRKIAGEDVAPSLTLQETEDGKGITFATSGRKRTRRTSNGSGHKGEPLTVVVNGEEKVYSAAAQAKKELMPERDGSEMSRDAIVRALAKKGYTVKA